MVLADNADALEHTEPARLVDVLKVCDIESVLDAGPHLQEKV